MKKILILGHKNPDTDSICSAIAYAELKKKLGINAEAVRLGNVNKETNYALTYFNVEAPRHIEGVSNEVDSIILVDHNEYQQSVDDRNNVKILEVIDHHRIANFETKDPLYYRCEPVGCTCTIIYKIYKENNIDIDKNNAGIMLSAILSDSLLFKSPTCTIEDIDAAKELACIACVDPEIYGLDMLKSGTDLGDKSAIELISLDSKEFIFGNCKAEVAQINTIDINDVLSRKTDIEIAMLDTINKKNLDLYLFVLTDIINSNSNGIVLGKNSFIVEKAFKSEIVNNEIFLKGIVSRKKQIIPKLNEAAI